MSIASLKSSEGQLAYGSGIAIALLVYSMVTGDTVTPEDITVTYQTMADGISPVVEQASVQYEALKTTAEEGGKLAVVWRLLDFIKSYTTSRTNLKINEGKDEG